MEEDFDDGQLLEMDHDSDDELDDLLMSDVESDEDYNTLYSCNICEASDMILEDFLSHTKLHTKEEKQSALLKLVNSKIIEEEAAKSAAAAFGFRVQDSLESSVTLYQCIVCGQGNLLLKNVQEHSKLHPQYIDSHFCNICQKQFSSEKGLASHLEFHLDNNDLICQYCNKTFSLIEDLESHEDQHYLAEYVCVECRQIFRSKEEVLRHLKKYHSVDTTCMICDEEFRSDHSITNHFMTHAVVRVVKRMFHCFTCDLCAKRYDSKVSLQRHKLFLHNDRLPFICEYCGFTAYHEDPMKEHLEKEHGKEEDLCVCCKCGPSFDEEQNSSTAKGKQQDRNTCKFCGMKFKQPSNLKHHLWSHGEVRNKSSFPESKQDQNVSKKTYPFKCNRCGETFNVEDFCVTHCTYHLDRVCCDLCGKFFENEMLLNHHLNNFHVSKYYKLDTENSTYPFKCNSCDSFFRLEFELEEHCEMHENIRYQCHLCFKEFFADNDLQDHLDTHGDEIIGNEETTKSTFSE